MPNSGLERVGRAIRRHRVLIALIVGLSVPQGTVAYVLPVTDVVRHGFERAIDLVEDGILGYQTLFRQWWEALARYLPAERLRGYGASASPPASRPASDDQFGYATGLDRALVGGDPTGARYAEGVSELRRIPDEVLQGMTPEARRPLMQRYSGIALTDGYEIVGWHAIALQRAAQQDINARLSAIEGDLRAPQTGNIANLQLLLATSLLSANVPMMTNAHLGLVVNGQLVEAYHERATYDEWLERDIAAKAELTVGATRYDGYRATWRLQYGQRGGS